MKLYIDPGTGSMLFTVLIGVIGALIYALRNAAVKTRFWVSGGKRRKSEKDSWPYVIFTDSKRYWNVFEPICDEMEKRRQRLLYLTASEDDPAFAKPYQHVKVEFAGKGNRAYARMNMLRADLVLSSTPGLDVYQWKRSQDVKWYVHIPHQISDLTSYRMFGIDYYDAILLTGAFQRHRIRMLEALRHLPEKELPVTGLPYLDTMLARVQTETAARNHPPVVLVAPSWGKSSIFHRYGESIFDVLLQTDYRIIIRPHPQSFESEKELMDRFMKRYPESGRLRWDRSNDNFGVLKEADLLISDYSGVMIDFSFVFGKPVIYADTSFDPTPYDAVWLKDDPFWLFTVLDRIGTRLIPEKVNQLPAMIEESLHSDALRESREAVRKESWECVGESAVRIADYLMNTRERLAASAGSGICSSGTLLFPHDPAKDGDPGAGNQIHQHSGLQADRAGHKADHGRHHNASRRRHRQQNPHTLRAHDRSGHGGGHGVDSRDRR